MWPVVTKHIPFAFSETFAVYRKILISYVNKWKTEVKTNKSQMLHPCCKTHPSQLGQDSLYSLFICTCSPSFEYSDHIHITQYLTLVSLNSHMLPLWFYEIIIFVCMGFFFQFQVPEIVSIKILWIVGVHWRRINTAKWGVDSSLVAHMSSF